MSRVLIIAEAGVNHNGDMKIAERLIDVAADAGADIVKFQTFKAEALVTKTAAMADYQQRNMQEKDGAQFAMLKKLELKPDQHLALIAKCRQRGIRFLSTGFDIESLDFLESFDLGIWKIPSGEITNLPYLEAIGRKPGQIILSTGMSTTEEVREAVKILAGVGVTLDRLTVLHCNTEYPTPYIDVNLRAMKALGDSVGAAYGYSDHTLGIEVPIAAVALGATVIEKHFTIDRNLSGPDHKASLEPSELKAMVQAIRNVSLSLGSDIKGPSASESKNIPIARKSIVAKRAIKKGEKYTIENLTTKRPGTGVSPMKWNYVVGHLAERDYLEDELIEVESYL